MDGLIHLDDTHWRYPPDIRIAYERAEQSGQHAQSHFPQGFYRRNIEGSERADGVPAV